MQCGYSSQLMMMAMVCFYPVYVVPNYLEIWFLDAVWYIRRYKIETIISMYDLDSKIDAECNAHTLILTPLSCNFKLPKHM